MKMNGRTQLEVLFNGGFVGDDVTPEDLGMEQDDLIEVYVGTNWSPVESDVEEQSFDHFQNCSYLRSLLTLLDMGGG